MEPTKKPKVKYFLKDHSTEVEQIINEFLSEHETVSLKITSLDDSGVMLLSCRIITYEKNGYLCSP